MTDNKRAEEQPRPRCPRCDGTMKWPVGTKLWSDWQGTFEVCPDPWHSTPAEREIIVSRSGEEIGRFTLGETQVGAPQEKLCGTAERATISTNEGSRPTANSACPSEGLLLPDEEWSHLSQESREKVTKWFSLAAERLQLILDGAEVGAQPPADLEQKLTDASFPAQVGGPLVVDLGTAIDIVARGVSSPAPSPPDFVEDYEPIFCNHDGHNTYNCPQIGAFRKVIRRKQAGANTGEGAEPK